MPGKLSITPGSKKETLRKLKELMDAENTKEITRFIDSVISKLENPKVLLEHQKAGSPGEFIFDAYVPEGADPSVWSSILTGKFVGLGWGVDFRQKVASSGEYFNTTWVLTLS